MSTSEPQPNRLSPAIRRQLALLRWMIRDYVRKDGAAAACIFIGAAFWCSLLADWFFEPPAWTRVLMLIAAAGFLLSIVVSRIVLRLWTPLGDANMALLLERRFGRLDDALLTAVELSGDFPAESEGFSSSMLADTTRRAEKRLAGLQIGEVINRGPLRRRVAAAGLLLFSIALFALFAPRALGVWARRSLMMSDELWPRKTRLVVEGFSEGVRKVARGSDAELVVMADCRQPLVPKTVDLRYRMANGSHRRAAMNREGNAVLSNERWQRYSYMFHGVQASIELIISGGDARIDGLRLEAVESPTINELFLSCEYPQYMNRKPRRLPVISTVTEIPCATRVSVHGCSDKKLRRVVVDESEGSRQKEQATIDMSAVGKATAKQRSFSYELGVVDEDRVVALSLVDVDGIASRQPLQISLTVKPDRPPDLPVSLLGIGTAVTPQARLPFAGRASDDYGIARLWFEFAVDKSAPAKVDLEGPQGCPMEIEIRADKTALEVSETDAVAGQKLLVALKAADHCDLGAGPNVGCSQRWLLDVVTPARLLSILQARELLLRQRFEAIIEEVNQTRDLLSGIDFEQAHDDTQTGPHDKASGDKTADSPLTSDSTPTEAEAYSGEPTSEDRGLSLRVLRCDRAIQNCLKNADEVYAAAQGFEQIRMQLINNRIDTPQMRTRLRAGIVEPLQEIAETMFPHAENLLRELRTVIADAEAGSKKRELAIAQLEVILLTMNEVLHQMLELEDYSQAVAMLRSIIDAQKKLGRQVERRHNAKLHELLED